MSEDFQFLSVKPLSQKTTRAGSADAVFLNVMKHNLREIVAEFGTRAGGAIDPSRIHENIILHGLDTSAGVDGAARDEMRRAEITTVRKNATLGIEIIFSLPGVTKIDCEAYFQDSMRWAQKYFDVPMLSAVIHNDESYPHLHVVMLPTRGGQLIGTKLMGDRTQIKVMQTNFNEQVGKRYGLQLQKPQKRHSAAVRRAAAQMAIDALRNNGELCATADAVVNELMELIAANPLKLLALMGKAMPQPKIKGTFAGTMTKPCKPERPNRRLSNALIGDFAPREPAAFEPEKAMSYPVLGHLFPAPSFPPPNEPPTTRTGATMVSHAAMMESDSTISQPATASTVYLRICGDAPTTATSTAHSSLATVASARPADSTTTAAPDPQPLDEGDYQRERDDDQQTGQWSEALGEFIKPTIKASCKPAVIASVRVALEAIGRRGGAPGAMRC
jgi:hypothetical protein